jgi:LemA protein
MLSSSLSLTLLIFAGVAFAVLVAYLVMLYNRLVQVKNNVEKTFKNIDVLLMQRHDELPKLIDTCKGYMKHERKILEKLTTLREH